MQTLPCLDPLPPPVNWSEVLPYFILWTIYRSVWIIPPPRLWTIFLLQFLLNHRRGHCPVRARWITSLCTYVPSNPSVQMDRAGRQWFSWGIVQFEYDSSVEITIGTQIPFDNHTGRTCRPISDDEGRFTWVITPVPIFNCMNLLSASISSIISTYSHPSLPFDETHFSLMLILPSNVLLSCQ